MAKYPNHSQGSSSIVPTSFHSLVSLHNIMKVIFLACVLIAGKSLTEAHIDIPFLRGGYVSLSTRASSKLIDRKPKNLNPIMFHASNIHKSLFLFGKKIQMESDKNWNEFLTNVGREWDNFSSNVAKLFPSTPSHGARKLDEVLQTFRNVLNGNEIDTGKLLNACRAHLVLMKSGGAALRVVAKDFESNVQKAEALFRKSPKEGRHLTSLLEMERESGIHDGNELQDPSAAMGLLWLRRSLAFQFDLYSSLIPSEGKHPRDVALDAYDKHLSPYHGWLLQKAFPLSLSQMPDREVFIAKFGGIELDDLKNEYEKEIVKKLKTLVGTWEPLLNTWKSDFERLNLEDMRRV